ncbi:hypothetical protein LINPERHAP1_LOCUS30814 [Linum perenne]
MNPRCPKVSFSEEELRNFYKPWSMALVVRVLERSFSFGAVKRRLETLWAKNGAIQVSDVANSFFLLRCADAEDYQRAAFSGPWKIYDYYLSVARWSPSFNEEEPLKSILTWVRLPRLSIHFFNKLAVSRIGNYIRKTVKIDLATSERARARCARVCVEIDVSKPLLGKYMIDDRTFYVEYESLNNICATCGFYGHKADVCTLLSASDPPTRERVVVADSTNPVSEGDAGEWMVVQRRSRGRTRKSIHESSKPGPNVPHVDKSVNAEVPTPPPETSKNVVTQKVIDLRS